MATNRCTLDVHVGEWPPTRWDEIDAIRATENPLAWGSKARPRITSEVIDWEALGLTPRWVGDDSSEAVAALEPSRFHNHGAQEWERFRNGATARGELALAVSTLMTPTEPTPIALRRAGASVMLAGADSSNVGGAQIALASPPGLVTGLVGADRDLALRIRTVRPLDLPWWALDLEGVLAYQGGFGATQEAPEGEISPLLASSAGEVVAAVWTSPDGSVRHYVVPFLPSYVPLLEWLVEQAVPEFVPTAARRVRRSLSSESQLLTTAEGEARDGLREFQSEVERRRLALQSRVERATADADAVRDPLLYASGAPLVAAVGRVLVDAHVDVTDLDVLLGDTTNADLLAGSGGRRVLVEVKSASGNPSERLAEAPARHLATWPHLRPDLPAEGVVLVLNHQTNTHPLDRTPQPFTRPEFVAALTSPVLTTRQLFDWWRVGDFSRIRSALFGDDPDPTASRAEKAAIEPPETALPVSSTDEPGPPSSQGRLWRRRDRKGGES
jgi:hypothetical protein